MRFTLRTFLLVVMFVAATSGIIAGRVIYVSHVLKSVPELEKHGVQVVSDFHERYGFFAPQEKGKRIDLIEWTLSDPQSITVFPCESRACDKLMEELVTLHTLKRVIAYNVTVRGLRQVAQLSNVESLNLDSPAIDDDSLAILLRLPKLQSLSLANAQITDQGLYYLARVPTLKDVTLHKTNVTQHGVANLIRLRPELTVAFTSGQQ